MRFIPWLLTFSIVASSAAAEFDPLATLRAGHPRLLITGAEVENDRDIATLTQAGRTLRVEILAPAGVAFSAHPAKPSTATKN